MFENFEAYLLSHGNFSPEDLKQMRALAVLKKLRKRQVLLHEGEVCRHKTFVAKGLLRAYRMRDDGTEYVMRFAAENNWMTDPVSLNNQTPSKYNIDALEPTEVVMWTRESFDALCHAIPLLREFSEKVKERSLDASQERIMVNISYTSEEKYDDFMASFPDVFRRVPLHMVASYLGVSRETLSRIRNARMKQHKSNGAGEIPF